MADRVGKFILRVVDEAKPSELLFLGAIPERMHQRSPIIEQFSLACKGTPKVGLRQVMKNLVRVNTIERAISLYGCCIELQQIDARVGFTVKLQEDARIV